MPTIPQLIYAMKSSNQQSISENYEVEIWSLGINFLQAASAWLSVISLNHETVTGGHFPCSAMARSVRRQNDAGQQVSSL